MSIWQRNYNQPGICSIEGEGNAGDAGGGGGASGAGGAGGGGQGTPWHAGLDEATVGVITTKGWDKMTPQEALAQSIKSYNEAEKFLGVPKDQLLRRPDPNDPASQAAFYQQLGKPADKTGYDFSAVKFADGSALDDGFVDYMRETADSLNLSKDAATAVAASLVKYMDQSEASEAGERTAAVTAQMDALKKEWGPSFDAHKFVANHGALKLGISQPEFDQMFQTPGGAKMLEIFRKVGELAGESRFVSNGGGGGNVLMTREQAVARKDELMRDDAWVTKHNNGDSAAVREMAGLNTIIVSNATEDGLF